MQHDYSIVTQRIFAVVFSLIALVAPVLGVTFSDSFGVRSSLGKTEQINENISSAEIQFHEKLFCSEWAGNCYENGVIRKVRSLIDG
ncbi:MAG: hypothetical protein VYE27_03225 [Pseudomonadota bacterium]|nr:hypothetical protein [Pseudomonadota bacterium]